MYFLNDKDVEKYAGAIIEAPALLKLKSLVRENFKEVLIEFMKETLVNRTGDIESYMNYQMSQEYSEVVFNQYGIDKKYHRDISLGIKKILVYYIEQLYQNKGSKTTLKIFGDLFENIFGSLNFYQIVVVKKKIIKDGVEQYYYSYGLTPLLINDKSQILTELSDKVSLTGKHLMSLEQYKEYSVFPVKTNMVYIHFIAKPNIDTLKTFNFAVRAYSNTILATKKLEFNNAFNNLNLKIQGNELELILFSAEVLRMRLFGGISSYNPQFTSGINFSVTFSQEHVDNIVEILHEYQEADYKDLKQIQNIKRKWNFLVNNYFKPILKFRNAQEVIDYLDAKYPDLIPLIQQFSTPEEYIDFYLEMYNRVLYQIDLADDYLAMYLNFIFLNVISGEAFIDNFFMPVYKLFQRYFFPIEMDFLNKITDAYIIKSKLDSFGTAHDVHTKLTLKGFLSKYHGFPDKIKVIFNFRINEKSTTTDKFSITQEIYQNSNNIRSEVLKQDERYKFTFIKYHKTDYNIIDKASFILLMNPQEYLNYIKDNISMNLSIKEFEEIQEINKSSESLKNYIGKTYDLYNLQIKLTTKDITKLKYLTIMHISSLFEDKRLTYSNNITITVNRFNYLLYRYIQIIYFIMYQEQYRKYTSWEQNLAYKYINQSDNIYYSMYGLYR